jgi:glycosyltransferase involved in cell wall biosynthesis
MTNRVWFDARSLSRGYTSGWERYVCELAKYLPNLIDITLWGPDTSNRLKLLLSDYQTQKSQSAHKLVHYPTYPPTKINKSLKKIVTVHDLTWWNFPETSSFLGKNYYKKNMSKAIINSDLIICPSSAIKEEIIQKFSKSSEDIEVIPHGNSLPNGFVNKPSKPYFLSIGTVEPRKNLDFYSKAIEKSKLNSNFDFIHVGRIGWGKLPPNLKKIDVKDDQELANLIINSLAVVIPSTYEGFGLPVLEAHVQGVPVIMSNVKSLMELSNDQDKIFDLSNLDSLVETLFQLSKNPIKLESKFIEDAKSYTWLNSAKKHVETYLRLLND